MVLGSASNGGADHQYDDTANTQGEGDELPLPGGLLLVIELHLKLLDLVVPRVFRPPPSICGAVGNHEYSDKDE